MTTDYVLCDVTSEFLNPIQLLARHLTHGGDGDDDHFHTHNKIESIKVVR